MIIKDIKLFDFIKSEDMLIPRSYGFPYMEQIPVPTEFVISEPQICTPMYARLLKTPFYMLNGNIVDYEELLKENNFHGASFYESVYLVEVWENGGDDGHTEYLHKGYRYVNQIQLENEKKYIYSYQGSKLPYCMTSWDEDGEYDIDRWKRDKEYIEKYNKV